MDKEAVHLYRLYGRLPSDVWNETPHQLFGVMFRQQKPAVKLPPLEGLTRVNAARAKKGLPPVTGRMFASVLQSVPDAKGGKKGG